MGPAAIGALMNNWPTPWAVAASAYLGLVTYDLTTFCPNDPPTLPTLTAADYFALIQIENPVSRLAAVHKFEDWIGARVWFEFCECVSGTQPTPPAAPAQPTGWPQSNPIVAHGTPCSFFHDAQLTPDAFSAPGGTYLSLSLTGNRPMTLVQTVNRTLVGAGPHEATTWDLQWQASGAVLFHTTWIIPAGDSTTTLSVPVPAAATSVIGQYFVAHTSTDTGWANYDLYCGDASGQTAPCQACPPDPILQAEIDAILKMVTLLQRQSAPFSYVYGANHTGLSGHGSIAVSGLIGVSVDVTTLPPGTGSLDGSPVQYFDLGYVTLGTADGYSTSRRIDHDGCLVLPPQAGAFTAIGYTLNAGVVASIRELVREP